MKKLGTNFVCALPLILGVGFIACEQLPPVARNALKPKVVTQPAMHDTDDPAIWIDEENPVNSLIIGTDKDEDGALMVYNLDGKIIEEKTVRGIKRPNNVDIRKV